MERIRERLHIRGSAGKRSRIEPSPGADAPLDIEAPSNSGSPSPEPAGALVGPLLVGVHSPPGAPDIDDAPWGLKELYSREDALVDIIAVHGLDGHRDGTWSFAGKNTRDKEVLWLRDLLPSKIPKARIWTWGYDSRTRSTNHKERLTTKLLYDHGRELVSELDGERRADGTHQRPIIFIAHSLGGIVVKNALLHSDRARIGHLEDERSVKISTYGIIFMGTPHQGATGVSIAEVALNIGKIRGNTNDSLLKHLKEHSELLQQQNSEFTSISGDFDIKFAYETLPTPVFGGKTKLIVPKWSAVVPGTQDAAELAISQDHIQMTKFSTEGNQDFKKISRMLVSMTQKAGVTVERNWKSEGRMRLGSQAYNVPFNIRGVPIVGKYVERQREMQNMEEGLLPEEENKLRRIFVLHGLGGIGKTQLSLAYARKHRNEYTAVFWLDRQTRESLKQSIVGIASQLPKDQISEFARGCTQQGNEQPDKVIQEVMEWFSRDGNGKWLLIYDNIDRDNSETVDDPEAFDVEDYLPVRDQGSIIITTRQHRLRNLGDEMSVTKMTLEEGLKVLENRIGCILTDNPQASELVDRVGGLPLALAQAASYIRETGTSMAEYLEFYNTFWDDLMKYEARPESTLREYGKRSVQTTWTISFEYVKRKNEDAANMLQVWSYLDNRDVWFELFNDKVKMALEHWSSPPDWFRRVVCNKLSFRRTAATLLDYSLIEARHESESYGVHPVVHEWCRKTMNADRRHESAFLAITSVAFTVRAFVDRDYWKIQRRILPHANRFSQQLMDVLEENLESKQTNVLHDACHNLGLLYSYSGRRMWVESEAMYRRAISGREKSLGSHHLETISTLSNLGVLYQDQERFVEAGAIHQRALAERTDQLGPDHENTIDSVQNLANAYVGQEKLVEAEDLYQRVLTWRQKASGSIDVRLLDIFEALGNLYRRQGKLTKSEAMYLQALPGYEAVLETNHPSRLRAYYNLGFLYFDQERLVEAEATFQRALEGRKKVFGLDHEGTLDVMHNLGFVFEKQGRLTEYEAVYQQALAGFIKVMGPGHDSTLRTFLNLGRLYERQGKLAEAEALYLQAIEPSEHAPDGQKDEQTLDLLNNLGCVYEGQGRLAEAETRFRQALTGFQTLLGPEHESTLRILHNLRICYQKQGKLAEAVPLCLQEVELYGPDARKDEKFFNLKDDLGVLYHRQDRLEKAETLYRQALAGYQMVLGPEHESTLRTLRNLRLCHEKQGKLAEAEALFQEKSTASEALSQTESISSEALSQEVSTSPEALSQEGST